MKAFNKHNKVLFLTGSVCLLAWFFEVGNSVTSKQLQWLLSYSASGLLLTSIALLTENTVLIYSLFCALFVMESLWCIDFSYTLLFHRKLIGLTGYAFVS